MELNHRIKNLRYLRRKTLDEVAKAVGVSNATVSRWETGDIKSIRTDKIEALAKALDTSTEYLLGIVDNYEPLPLDSLAGWLSSTFRERLSIFLACADSADLEDCFGTNEPYKEILDGTQSVTFKKAMEIVDECGISLAWLYGLTDDPFENPNIFGSKIDKNGLIDLTGLVEIFMKSEKISLEAATAKAEQYIGRFRGHNEIESELLFYFRNAAPELQKAALAVLKSAASEKISTSNEE